MYIYIVVCGVTMEDNFIGNHYIAKYCKYRVGYYKNDSGQKDYN